MITGLEETLWYCQMKTRLWGSPPFWEYGQIGAAALASPWPLTLGFLQISFFGLEVMGTFTIYTYWSASSKAITKEISFLLR
jgi:hypothetical protein